MNRREVLEAAIKCVCQDRQDQHGNPENTFAMIADMWEIYLSHKYNIDLCVAPDDVCVMMALFKASRYAMGSYSADNAVDGAGYFALADEIRSAEMNRHSQSLSEAFNLDVPAFGIKKDAAIDTGCRK